MLAIISRRAASDARLCIRCVFAMHHSQLCLKMMFARFATDLLAIYCLQIAQCAKQHMANCWFSTSASAPALCLTAPKVKGSMTMYLSLVRNNIKDANLVDDQQAASELLVGGSSYTWESWHDDAPPFIPLTAQSHVPAPSRPLLQQHAAAALDTL